MRLFLKFILCASIIAPRFPAGAAAPELERLRVTADGRGFVVGKPIVIEETFLLKCSREEFVQFLRESKSPASGRIGFYWGRTLAECRKSRGLADALMASRLEIFQAGVP